MKLPAWFTVFREEPEQDDREEAVAFTDGRILIVPAYWPEEEETFPPDWAVLGCW